MVYVPYPAGQNFNPRAPQGARPFWRFVRSFVIVFQSTRSAGSATCKTMLPKWRMRISIHALRRERD